MGESRDAGFPPHPEVEKLREMIYMQRHAINNLEREREKALELVDEMDLDLQTANNTVRELKAEIAEREKRIAQLELANSQVKIINGILREGLAKVESEKKAAKYEAVGWVEESNLSWLTSFKVNGITLRPLRYHTNAVNPTPVQPVVLYRVKTS